jgi:uncharacterized protein (TIGR00369 family)
MTARAVAPLASMASPAWVLDKRQRGADNFVSGAEDPDETCDSLYLKCEIDRFYEAPMSVHDDDYCFGCGKKNDMGLRLRHQRLDDDLIKVEFTVGKGHVGWKDTLHGGIISCIFDDLLGKTAMNLGVHAATARLEVRYHKQSRVGEKLTFYARMVKRAKKLLFVELHVENGTGQKMATGTGKLFIIDE